MNAPLEIVLAELRSRLQTVFGQRLDRVILFGSRARGDADPDSDIDVMIVLKEPSEAIGLDRDRCSVVTADISLKYGAVISTILTDDGRLARSGLPLYRNVRREGVVV
ncbi:MAG TPA: nucleotidyltransferase domain-containing protein [Alphaproteobacteria bacterium]|jgi:predicted nucleotidyltransferase